MLFRVTILHKQVHSMAQMATSSCGSSQTAFSARLVQDFDADADSPALGSHKIYLAWVCDESDLQETHIPLPLSNPGARRTTGADLAGPTLAPPWQDRHPGGKSSRLTTTADADLAGSGDGVRLAAGFM
ncbi:hypothetical protein AXG93_2931s1010 [Marchantia polymorpha subsp. ruderalis]|uniref:Uncharacterized protein n=1 Tax=Marchantia polymorpha subsp. ruderalis TaxID=1480154 RepID=A0A176VVM9_MARPO|nr:hypothetical protein AXG93_2931s1010 [Marchantia polymorpha subsp. ruderalis]